MKLPTRLPTLQLRSGASTGIFNLLSAFAIATSYADRSNISTAIIPMASELNWDSAFSGIVLSSFWGGYAVTQIFGGRLADKFGGEKLLVLALGLWSLCTALTPYAATAGGFQVVLTRVLLGAGEGLALPAVHSMIKKYVSVSSRSTSASIITAACYGGALASNSLAPLIIQAGGWKSCFLLFSIVPPIIWLPLWMLFLQSFEVKSFEVRGVEAVVEENIGLMPRERTEEISAQSVESSLETGDADTVLGLRQLLALPPIWAIIAAQYGQSWGMIGLLSWLPTYYSDKFGIPLSSLSSFTVLPYFLQMVVAIAAGYGADGLINSGVKRLWVRQGFQITGMLVPAVCLACCAYAPGLTANTAADLINVGTAASALTVAAVSSIQFDISPRNAGTIFGIGNTASCIGGLIAVPISGYIYSQTHSWDTVFVLFAIHYVLGALLWGVWASTDRLSPFGSTNKKNMF